MSEQFPDYRQPSLYVDVPNVTTDSVCKPSLAIYTDAELLAEINRRVGAESKSQVFKAMAGRQRDGAAVDAGNGWNGRHILNPAPSTSAPGSLCSPGLFPQKFRH